MFEKIRISTTNVFLDPLINLLIPFSWCKNASSRKRRAILDKSQEMFSNELSVTNILDTMREMRGMLKHLQNSEHRLLLKFSSDRVIKLSDSDDSEKPEQDDCSQEDFNSTFSTISAHDEQEVANNQSHH
jgi:hypothetical protein